MSDPVTIINCLEYPVYVHTVTGLVALERIPVPKMLTIPEGDGKFQIKVPGDSTLLTEIEMYEGVKIYGALNIPPVVEGLLYLVEAETLLEFPERTDFVTPAMWAMPTDYLSEGSEFINILMGVTRNPFHVIGVDGAEDIAGLLADTNLDIDAEDGK